MLIEASRCEPLERASGPRVQFHLSFSQQARVGNLARHRVLERVFRFREKRFLVQELCGLQIPHAADEVGMRDFGHGLKERLPDVVADDRSALKYFL